MAPLPVLSGLAEIADRYDGYIIDLWGVVHDGVRAFPGVLDCLGQMRAAGKTTCMLSNAPRRVEAVREKLRSVGVPDDAYDHVMTSGEATHDALRDRPTQTEICEIICSAINAAQERNDNDHDL